MPKSRRASAHPVLRRISLFLALVALASLASALSGSVAAATPVTVGYRDIQYGDPAAPGGDDVTANRSQSKLWTNDARWFGILFDPRSTPNAKFRIWRFDVPSQNWTNTGVPVDDRNRSHADVLSVGNTIYIASARAEGLAGTVGRDLRIYKYTYNATLKTYAAVAGFPKIIGGTAAGTGYSTIAQDSSGDLFVVFTQANRVRVTGSGDNAATWSAPIDLPNMGNDITVNDTAAIASMNGGVGVLWSNQAATDDSFYFVARTASGSWQARETAFGTASAYDADGHISLKTDPSGNLMAAVKTGRNDDPAPNGGDPLITLLNRTGSASAVGSWGSHIVTSVTVGGTRPVLVIDEVANQANVFLTAPEQAAQGQQSIYRRTAPLSTLNFGTPSLGTAFIRSATEVAINDATSTKQRAIAATGILVEATNIPTLHYLHNCAGAACPQPAKPVANFTSNKTSGAAPLTVQFTDTSTNAPTSWSWTFGDGGTSTAQNPSHTYASAGTYTVSLTASNGSGGSTVTKTGYITVAAKPVANFTANKTSGTAPLTVQFTDTSTNNPTAWSWTFGDGGTSTAKNPSHVYADPGTYTVTLTASNLAGSDGETKTNFITVQQPPETSYFTMSPTRVLDTRPGIGIGLSGAFTPNNPRTLSIAGAHGIPADAVAITGNLTVVGQTKAGYLSITPNPTANPTTSTLNFPLGDTRANGVTVPLNGSGDVSIVYKASSGSAHVLLDVTGYFRKATTGTSYFAFAPKRVLDSRFGVGLAGTFTPNNPRTLSIAGANGIPATAKAITGNLTVVGQTKAGYLSITPSPTANPTTSTLNFPLGDTRANGVTVPLNGSGDLSIVYKASSGSTNVILDVTGYFLQGTSGATFVPLTPARILDTRFGIGLSSSFQANVSRSWATAGKGGVGSDAIAVIGNVTVVGQTKAGYVSITPNLQANPTTSTINFPLGDTRANNFTVQLSPTGSLYGIYKAPTGARTHLLVDVTGYYK